MSFDAVSHKNSTLNWLISTGLPGAIVLAAGGLAYYVSSIDPSSKMPFLEGNDGDMEIEATGDNNVDAQSGDRYRNGQTEVSNGEVDCANSCQDTGNFSGSTLDLDSVLLALLQQSSDMKLMLDTLSCSAANQSNPVDALVPVSLNHQIVDVPNWIEPLAKSVGNLEMNMKAIMLKLDIVPVDDAESVNSMESTSDDPVEMPPTVEAREKELYDAYVEFLNSNMSEASQKASAANIVLACNTLKMYFNKLVDGNTEKPSNLSRFKKIVTSNSIFVKNVGKVVVNYEDILYFTGYIANYKNSCNSSDPSAIQSFEYIWGSSVDVEVHKDSVHCRVDSVVESDSNVIVNSKNSSKKLLLLNKYSPSIHDSQRILRKSIDILNYVVSCCDDVSKPSVKIADPIEANSEDDRALKECKSTIRSILCKDIVISDVTKNCDSAQLQSSRDDGMDPNAAVESLPPESDDCAANERTDTKSDIPEPISSVDSVLSFNDVS